MVGVIVALAQMADDVVGAQVHVEAQEEDADTDDKLRRPEPGSVRVGKTQHVVVGIVGFEEDPVALHHRVEDVEGDTHKHHGKRHLAALAFHQPREDDGTLEIVYLEDEQEHHRHKVEAVRRAKP